MEENKSRAVIEVTESGPLKITGTFILKDMKTGTETRPTGYGFAGVVNLQISPIATNHTRSGNYRATTWKQPCLIS
jgi:hypothetical protein